MQHFVKYRIKIAIILFCVEILYSRSEVYLMLPVRFGDGEFGVLLQVWM